MNKVRLIDANALKEDLKQYFTDGVLDGVSARLAFNQILHDIDNAPTVPQDCSECKRFDFPYVTINVEFTEEEKQEIIEKVRKNLLARPQGEWVENLMHTTICSNCGGIRRDNRVDYIAFCNKCGADMR